MCVYEFLEPKLQKNNVVLNQILLILPSKCTQSPTTFPSSSTAAMIQATTISHLNYFGSPLAFCNNVFGFGSFSLPKVHLPLSRIFFLSLFEKQLAGLEFVTKTEFVTATELVFLDSQRSVCLCPLTAGLKGMCHHPKRLRILLKIILGLER